MLQSPMFPIDHRPVSAPTGKDFPRRSRSGSEERRVAGAFSSVFASATQPRTRLSNRQLSSPWEDGEAHEPDRLDQARRAAPSESSRRSRSAGSSSSESSSETQQREATAPRRDQVWADTAGSRGSVTGRTEDLSEVGQDQPAAPDQPTEQGDTSWDRPVDVTIALCVCLAAPVTVNAESQTPADGATEPAVTAESLSTSTQAAVGTVTERPLQQTTHQTMEAMLQRPPVTGTQGKEDQALSAEVKPELVDNGLVPTDPAGSIQATMLEAQTATETETFASLVATENKPASGNELVRVSPAALPSDAPPYRAGEGGTEPWHEGDHPATDLMVDHRASMEWSQSGSTHNHATGERDGRPSGDRSESPGPSHGHAQRESGFGETVAALTADKPAPTDGNASRLSASFLTGRAASASWPTGDEHVPMMQAVSLNLEPADLGPVNVRIFMMERTVHAHIRTDHMDFGQGMLNQQQQLETRLQTSGLEMGDFKVTVDHQQLSRDDSQAWLGHQADRRHSVMDSQERAPEGEVREGLPAEHRRHLGIMSFFA